MATVNQYRALASIEKSLADTSQLVDGRTEQDWLFFLGEFAALINFYDQDNTVNGNWSPFLLKDPVFLLASIAKTKVKDLHAVYFKTKSKLVQLFAKGIELGKIGIGINEMLEQIFHVFLYIKRWVYYVQTTVEEYELKSYIIAQVKNIYSVYFWAISSLRQTLFSTTVIPGISKEDPAKLNAFQTHEELIWNKYENKEPYWQVLGLQHPITNNKPEAIFKSIAKAGDEIFVFFNNVVSHAQSAFEKLSAAKSIHPDTTLLRTFVHLLKLQQNELNKLSARHLDFYYQDILQQVAKPAKADRVFASAELLAADSLFWLPPATAFDAGVDEMKNPIYFANETGLWLNPAKITGVQTLCKMPLSTGSDQAAFYLGNMADPGTLKLDAGNQVMAWPMFNAPGAVAQKDLGIAFASPMLLLREGSRTINISIEYKGLLDEAILASASYFLSTATAWLKVVPVGSGLKAPLANGVQQLSLQFSLFADQPAIEAFIGSEINGFEAAWPMLKITFDNFLSTGELGTVVGLAIETEVSDMSNLQLYNDHGGIIAKAPYAMFGTTPLLSSSFLVGSNEIFSKPVQKLNLALNWGKLPDDFGLYYKAYNDYLHQKYTTAENGKRSWLGRFFHWIKTWFVKDEDTFEEPYYNGGFKVDFKLLQAKSWLLVNAVSETDPTHIPASVPLFDEDADFKLLPATHFSCQPDSAWLKPDAAIQLQPLVHNEESTSGFIKLQLASPMYGFGSELYPAIVYEQALANARLISKKSKKIVEPAKVPFVPILAATQAGYTAKQSYTLGADKGYPLSCYHFSPFGNYEIYNERQGRLNQGFAFGPADGSLPIAPVFAHNGLLFLEIDELLPTSALSVYFELKPQLNSKSPILPVSCFYLGDTGWQPLTVVADGTNNLSASGIMRLKIPNAISSQTIAMPKGKYWICLATNEDPALFADVLLISTNGFEAERLAGHWQSAAQAPLLPANAIAQPKLKIAAIKSLLQPFPSFGGRGAEEAPAMGRRVGKRLKTKDRLRAKDDCLLLIRSEFPEIFYAKAVYSQLKRSTAVYLVGRLKNWTSSASLLPTLAPALVQDIQGYVAQRSSAFAAVEVQAFEIQYLMVSAKISLQEGFEPHRTQQAINAALNLYLSPWAETETEQVTIDEPIGLAQVLNLIKSIAGVWQVRELALQTWLAADEANQQTLKSVSPLAAGCLIVPCLNHQLKCEVAI